MKVIDFILERVSPSKKSLLFIDQEINTCSSYLQTLIKKGYSFGIIDQKTLCYFQQELESTPFSSLYTLKSVLKEQHLICFSSNSNGHPKAVLRTFASWKHSFNIQQNLLDYPRDSSCMIIGSLSHSLHFFGLLESFYRKTTPTILPFFSAKRFFEECNSSKPSILYATPPHISILIKHFKQSSSLAIESIKFVLVGGAQVNSTLISEFQQIVPHAQIREFFGATETSYISIKTPSCPVDSVGKLCPNVKVEILDKSHQPVPNNTKGSIWVKSNQLYSKIILGNDMTLRNKRGYICVGDLGYLDNSNHLYFCGRSDLSISISGKKVSLELPEKALKKYLKTEEVVVITIPNTLKENELIAITSKQITFQKKKDALSHLRTELGALSTPKKIISVTHWPLLSSGKTDRIQLKKIALT